MWTLALTATTHSLPNCTSVRIALGRLVEGHLAQRLVQGDAHQQFAEVVLVLENTTGRSLRVTARDKSPTGFRPTPTLLRGIMALGDQYERSDHVRVELRCAAPLHFGERVPDTAI